LNKKSSQKEREKSGVEHKNRLKGPKGELQKENDKPIKRQKRAARGPKRFTPVREKKEKEGVSGTPQGEGGNLLSRQYKSPGTGL